MRNREKDDLFNMQYWDGVNRKTNYQYSLTMNDYQADTASTAIYKWKVVYPALGLASEAGEVCDKIKKLIRDHGIDQSGLEDLKDAQRVDRSEERRVGKGGRTGWSPDR